MIVECNEPITPDNELKFLFVVSGNLFHERGAFVFCNLLPVVLLVALSQSLP